MSIEGEWKGRYSYSQPGPGSEDCPFTAQIRCVSRNISGSIVDHRERVTVTPYRPIFEASKASMTPKQVADTEEFLRQFPDAALRSELPLEAEIDGELRLSRIWFVKRYSGPHKISWILGNREVVQHESSSHKVWYEGRLSPGEDVIEGTWKIRPTGILGQWQEPSVTGTFRMDRG